MSASTLLRGDTVKLVAARACATMHTRNGDVKRALMTRALVAHLNLFEFTQQSELAVYVRFCTHVSRNCARLLLRRRLRKLRV